ncbi:hypothetical protein SAICODRAFT_75496 [Saitoella complicata NRRL Y-17804]|uniref:U6 small nuclear RNA (adenine-(43)-N(6))-methyltransferase n=1 Tax=Saitoella complicata (strain BCRC 22490 / CBS 7301 / JCM 7358 / NBRC 10748 / NRRL Y-17804) TaxID=698492 RepID=A0A0E9N841_SAICN|nr:uncharacterized protein SAICODRAFT_75496 [Saitoella complicata NRRL Y-17804]ODQ55663.1 hypothetical protein SAICODRAFT_75496 [Saitoella complicata NRRL Y-17804]GAO46082.1 hypothetical protein G7K_0325-t1 [Saitoella complicata NRRL Y-17804]
MHERNLFCKNPPDFKALALKYKSFAEHARFDGSLDFQDAAALRALTTTLLEDGFGLKVQLPKDRLCPPVPNRLDYMLWLQDLLDSTEPSCETKAGEERENGPCVLDIGTGASAIYPLLGCALRPTWSFIATDIDGDSIVGARQSVALNGLEDRIRLLNTRVEDKLINLDAWGVKMLDAVMCNPPFYDSAEDMQKSESVKEEQPFAALTATKNELITPGGELAFIRRILAESRTLGTRVLWYTSLCGHLSTLQEISRELSEANMNYGVGEFVQARTKRWVIGWSFRPYRPDDETARHAARSESGTIWLGKKCKLPPSTIFSFMLRQKQDLVDVKAKLVKATDEVDVRLEWEDLDQDHRIAKGFANVNTWSRSARRKRKRDEEAEPMPEAKAKDEVDANFGFTIELRGYTVKIRWTQGFDKLVYESFCGWVKRALDT